MKRWQRRILRILAWTAAGGGALALLLGITLAFLVGTQTGTRFLFGRLGALMPGTFSVESAAGRIDSPLTLRGVVYRRPGTEVRIDRLYLEWRLRELLSRRVDVGRLYADGVHVISTPQPSQPPSALPNLDLHFNIVVRDARVRGLTLASVAAGGAPVAGAAPASVSPASAPSASKPVSTTSPAPAASPAPPAPAASPASAGGQPGTGAAPTVIDEIDLKTTDIMNRVHIDRLSVRSALLQAEVTGTVQPQGDYPVDLAVRWTVHPPGPGPTAAVVGGGTLTGDLQALRVSQRLSAPFDVRLAAVLHQPMRDLSFDGQVAFSGVNPRRLRPDLPDLPASGLVAARGSFDRFDSWGTVAGTMAPAGPFQVSYRVARNGDSWRVGQAVVTLPGTTARLELSGRATLPAAAAGQGGAAGAGSSGSGESAGAGGTSAGAGDGSGGRGKGGSGGGDRGEALDVDLQAVWRDAAWPPRGTPSFASPRGSAHVKLHADGPSATPVAVPPGGASPTVAIGPSSGGAAGAGRAAGTAGSAASPPGLLDRLSSEGSVQAVVANLGPLAVNYRVVRAGANWRLDQLQLGVPGTAAQLSGTGRIDQSGPALAVAGEVGWHDLAWPLTGPAEVRSAQGEARVTGTLDSFRAQISAAVATPGAAPAAAAGAAASTAAAARERAAAGTVPATATTLPAAAGAAGGQGPVARHSAPTAPTAPGAPAAQSAPAAARHTAAGSAPAAATAAGGPAALPPALRAGRFSLAGSGNRNQFHIEALTADVLSGHLQGHGDVAWSPRLRWNLALAGDGLDPGAVQPDFPGRLGFALDTRGESQAAGLAGSVDLHRLQGTLRGQPLTASAAVLLAGASYNLPHLDAQWGGARLQVRGQAGDALALAFNAAVPNVGLLLPGATGSVTAEGHVAGDLKTPHVQATVNAQGVRYGSQSASAASLQADVSLAPAGPFQVSADVRQLNTGSQLIARLGLHSRGTTADHTLDLTVSGLGDSASAQAALGLTGGVVTPAGAPAALNAHSIWRGRITRLDVRSAPIGDWSLSAPAALTAGAQAVELRDLCWVEVGSGSRASAATAKGSSGGEAAGRLASGASGASAGSGSSGGPSGGGSTGAAATGGGRLCASAAWSAAGPWAGEATLTALPLKLLKPLLPADLTITGDVNGSAKAHGGSRGIAGADVDLAPGPGDLRFPGEDGRTLSVHFDRGTLRLQAGPAGGTASADLNLPAAASLRARLRLPRLTQGLALAGQPLAGTVAVHAPSLQFLEGFLPGVRRLAGALDADLTLSGTAGRPDVAGQARLTGGSADLPLYGLKLRDVGLTASGNGGSTLTISAAARSAPGSVQIAGTAGLAPSAATPLHLTVSGSRFAVMDTRDVRILVTPKLDLVYSGAEARVTGQVTIPEAHIHVDSPPKGGPLEPSKDVVFVGGLKPRAEQPAAPPLAVRARVLLVVPNPAIELDALGLKGQPYGQVLLIESPGQQPVGTGELDIAKGGTFQAYGQNLTIQTGRLVFGGALDDPGLDLRASRLSNDQTVTAGIQARGSLKKPEISVWSTPTMGESDALAYVVLGHGLNQASAQEGNRVANAASSLGIAGAGMLAKNIGARFGLEEATIESTGNLNQASLMLGKYLAPHLYVVYGIGLFQPINIFQVRYIINSRWTLQAENSTETGADILYTLERGHTH